MLNFKLIVTTKGKDLGVAADSSLKTSAQQAEAVKNGQMEHGDKCNDKKPWPKVWTDIKILHVSILIIATKTSQCINSPLCNSECKAQVTDDCSGKQKSFTSVRSPRGARQIPAAAAGVLSPSPRRCSSAPFNHTRVHHTPFPHGFTAGAPSPSRIP